MTHGRTFKTRGAARSLLALIGAAVMAGVGLDSPQAAQASTPGSPLKCEPGFVYSVSATGNLVEIAPNGSQNPIGTGWQGQRINGLAIAAGGTHAYAYERLASSKDRSDLQLRRYDAASGVFNSDTRTLSVEFRGALVAGAVNLDTGEFVFGGFQKANRRGSSEIQFRAFGVTPSDGPNAPVRDIGYFWTGHYPSRIGSGALNGDLAFDANGNLFVVGAKNTATLYTVASEDLAAANGGELPTQSSRALTVDLEDVNGIAFDQDGTIFLGDSSTVNRYNPSNWKRIASHTSSLTKSTDLASCASPATLAVTKDVTGRVLPTDQFTLAVATEDDDVVASATTTGSADGVQSEQVVPIPAVQHNSYRISEEAAEGTTDLANYETTWSCSNTVDGTIVAAGTGSEGLVTIPGPSTDGRSAIVECAFTNTPRSTTLTLVKAFNNTFGAPAEASDWRLWAQGADADRIEFASGETFQVPHGPIELGEEQRDGYVLDSVACSVYDTPRSVDDANRVTLARGEHAVCTLTNRDLPGSVRWSKVDSVTGDPLPGSEWMLRGPDGDDHYPVLDNFGEGSPTTQDTDARSGYFELRDLTWGDYSLEETSPPAGYELPDPASFSFTVSADAREAELGPIANDLRLQFGLEKLAYDRGKSAPTPISGATFLIHDDDSGAPGPERSNAINAAENGRYTIDGLRPGKYWLVEAKAPAGFAPLTAPVGFTVSQDAAAPSGRVSLTEDDHPLVRVSSDGSTLRVYDARGVELPSSGGPGAALYTIAGTGVALLSAALWLAASKKRRSVHLRHMNARSEI